MNADSMRRLFDYHMGANRRLWDECVAHLSEEQFMQDFPYSHGSIRNQCVHLFNTDKNWFAGLAGALTRPQAPQMDQFPDKDTVRAAWDSVEESVRAYLDRLQDADLDEIFGPTGMAVWEVLFHVLNHGTDHRSQILTVLDQMGAPTFEQDYLFFAMQRW